MLEFTNQQAKLASFNSRGEHHGQEIKAAADLKFETNCTADILAELHPTLRHFLFCKNDGDDADLADQAHDAPNLRFAKLKYPLAWELETIGQCLTIHFGLGGKSDIVIDDCKVNAIQIAPQEGGTVIVSFRVQGYPTEKDAGKLFGLVQHDVAITLDAPDLPGTIPADHSDVGRPDLVPAP